MELTTHTAGIRSDLEILAGSDGASQVAAERISLGLEPALHLRLLDVLGEAALEFSEQLPGGHVDVRLSGRDVRLVFVPEESVDAGPSADEEAGTVRLTLRMPEPMKTAVETAAGSEGLSTNAWLVRAVGNELGRGHRRTRRGGSRVTGFAQG
jgi:hypothetical protein